MKQSYEKRWRDEQKVRKQIEDRLADRDRELTFLQARYE